MRSFAAAALIAVGLSAIPARADAITLREVIELTRAGLGEEVLLALIEIDQRVFPVDPATMRMLKDAGVSEKVIVAIVKSGRTPPPLPPADLTPVAIDPPAAPEPQVVVIEHDRPIVHEVAVPVPVFITVPTHRFPRAAHSTGANIDNRTILDNRTVLDNRTIVNGREDLPRKPAAPVYWGWGGKLRPDAWQPSPADVRRDR
jgi:hypothetical protein